MIVNLEVGMTGIRRDGKRVGPAVVNIKRFKGTHTWRLGRVSYTAGGEAGTVVGEKL